MGYLSPYSSSGSSRGEETGVWGQGRSVCRVLRGHLSEVPGFRLLPLPVSLPRTPVTILDCQWFFFKGAPVDLFVPSVPVRSRPVRVGRRSPSMTLKSYTHVKVISPTVISKLCVCMSCHPFVTKTSVQFTSCGGK